jgi:hypothetical protein
MKPVPPAGSPDRRGKSPPLLSPSSSSAFPAAAVSEHACVCTPLARPMLLLLGRVSILFLFFSPSSFPLYWLRRVCPDAIWCSARAWWPAFRVSRSRCKSGGWQPRKGTTRRSLSPGDSNGKHFFRGEGGTRGAISGGPGLSGWQLVSFVFLGDRSFFIIIIFLREEFDLLVEEWRLESSWVCFKFDITN